MDASALGASLLYGNSSGSDDAGTTDTEPDPLRVSPNPNLSASPGVKPGPAEQLLDDLEGLEGRILQQLNVLPTPLPEPAESDSDRSGAAPRDTTAQLLQALARS
uniref:Uncharacterized protein n=1 Tax=Phaeomonas parva TaxID=124430 RepID=A0A7S1UB72_9STRA|mmetsp:Transcript_40136/g.125678  ORF Transcript_40136/g.125678 Transcript_40136/m.125678 type:complete len:105 (+) Transcript_40136:519-833(+)